MTPRNRAALAALAAVGLVVFSPSFPAVASDSSRGPHGNVVRAREEAAFMRSVDRANTLNVITGDLVRSTGLHVAYACTVERNVQRGVVLADCGSAAEPIDVFVHMPTDGVNEGRRMRILGVVEQPAAWTDVSGHTVYYAFIRAVFVDPIT